MPRKYEYTGEAYKELPAKHKDPDKIYPYIPEAELIDAVNMAIFLNRPLLLEGEPGSGKTQLARDVAYELKLKYERYTVKSISKVEDLLYSFDVIDRLRDAQLAINQEVLDRSISEIRDIKNYIKDGILAKAFKNAKKTGQKSVILIDEIDKADADFPNDLLEVLEWKGIVYEELRKRGDEEEDYRLQPEEDHCPIIIITTNSEKRLSNAFLRRCIYHYVKFPENEKRIKEITEARFKYEELTINPDLLEAAVQIFCQLRKEIKEESSHEYVKNVSTSEWIDWIRTIHDPKNEKVFWSQYENGNLPFANILLKTVQALEKYSDFKPDGSDSDE